MPVKIQNQTKKPVLLRLNSGKTLHLAPNAISSELRDAEVDNNAKVQKLQDRLVITLHKIEKIERQPTESIKKKAESAREKNVKA